MTPTHDYDDFRVTFTPRAGGAEGHYDVRVQCTGWPPVDGTFVAPPEDELTDLVLGVTARRSAGTTRREQPTDLAAGPTVRAVGANLRAPVDRAEVGQRLTDALLTGAVGQLYEAALQRVAGNDRGVRLTLALGATPELLSIPWEFLRREQLFLASQTHTPVVRQITGGVSVAPARVSDVVRVLAVIANPTDLAPLDVAQEKARVDRSLEAMRRLGRVQVDWIEGATRARLRGALAAQRYHVLHYIGHSAFDQGKGRLFLQTDEGTKDPVDTEWLANMVADERQLRLAFLNSCEGARTSVRDPHAGVAATLLQIGVPAVVAMQFEISDDVAILFAEELYTNLIARQLPIDASVAEARKAVLGDLGSDEFATPVLFVQDPEVDLFEFERDADGDLPPLPGPGEDGRRTLPQELATPLTVPAPHATPRRRLVVAAVAGILVLALAGWLWLGPEPDPPPVTEPPAAVVFPTLRLGARGPAVEAAQLLLIDRGHRVDASGFFDEATGDAITAFDDEQGLPADAILGPLTWSELVRNLRVGATGDAVRAAQVLLRANGGDVAVTGQFDDATVAATRAVERANALHLDGIVDRDVWRVLAANAPMGEATPTDSGPETTGELATTVVNPAQPRPATLFGAAVVERDGRSHLVVVNADDPTAAPIEATPLGDDIDRDPDWEEGTNRLAFSRTGADGDVGVFYVVPGNGRGDRGKTADRLVTGHEGTERLPSWASDGSLYYAATDGCAPGSPGCADTVRRARFAVDDREGEAGAAGEYLDDVRSHDTLSAVSDDEVAGAFEAISAIDAHPSDPTRAVVLDAHGLWLLDRGGATLVVPRLTGRDVTWTESTMTVVVADDEGLTLIARDWSVRATVTVAGLERAVDGGATIPADATVTSLDRYFAFGQLVGYLAGPDDQFAGATVRLSITGSTVTIEAVLATPVEVTGTGRVTAVAI